ncbi:MAG: ribose-phosphate pyrophosphokinase [Caldilineales bacterium]|nr:ribose-phosphate pyrophosphokinase [Caldilineales bacterium]
MSEGLYGELAVVGGSCHPQLTAEICDHLRVKPTPVTTKTFANRNIFVRLGQSVRAKDVFLVQTLGQPVNDMVMELLITIDALRRDSAGRITAVVPYYAYGRTDKKDQPRVPITARLLADMITVAGADRFLTLDLHAGQIQGFFTIPNDELTAHHIFIKTVQDQGLLRDAVIVSPDIGGVRRARNLANDLRLPLAIVEKRRHPEDGEAEIYQLIGEVAGKRCLLIDDEIDTAGTISKAANLLKKEGAGEIYALATHAVFSENAAQTLADAPFTKVLVTNSLPISPAARQVLGERLQELKVGGILGEAIRRIHHGISVGAMYEE